MAASTDAKTIIDNASLALGDVGAVHWNAAELLAWLNAGQLELATLVPNANTVTVAKQLVAGSKQTAPSDAIRLIGFTRNLGVTGLVPGKAIRQIERKLLERYSPNWSTEPAAAVVLHAMYDAEDNNAVFYVYPPQPMVPQYIELIYAQIPAIIANATAGTKVTVADFYQNALLDYVLYRALGKDSEYGNQDAKALAHYQSFMQAIGAKFKADSATETLSHSKQAQ